MTREQADQLVAAFGERFGAEVEAYPDSGNGRYQFTVFSPKFAELTNLQRQDEVWKVIDQVLSREAGLDVSMVWAFAPGEVEEWIEGLSK